MSERSAQWLERAAGPLASWLQTAPGFAVDRGAGWWRVGCDGAKPDMNCLAITGEGGPLQEALAQGFESVLRAGRSAIICVAAEHATAVVSPMGLLPVRSAGMLPHYLLQLDELVMSDVRAVDEIERVHDLEGFSACMDVLTAAFDDPYNDPEGAFRSNLLEDSHFTFRLARIDGLPASSVVTWRDGTISYVTIMATHPAFQGKGVGRQLLQQALIEERSTGATHAHLVSSDVGAYLYRAAGFRLIANHPLWLYDGNPDLGF